MESLPEFLARREPRRIPLIAQSFERLVGRPLADGGSAQALWDAPLAIVAHGTEPDPVFFFGNRMALTLFEMTAPDFTALPSRLSAEPDHRQARADLMARVARDGFTADYSGIRISAAGRRFRIESAFVWNLADGEGRLHGQAAAFDRWTYLD